jgi:hypothetical protein
MEDNIKARVKDKESMGWIYLALDIIHMQVVA